MFKVNNKIPEQRQRTYFTSTSSVSIVDLEQVNISWGRCSVVFTANFEQISHLVLVFLVLTLISVEQYIKLEKKLLLLHFRFEKY